jgi:hypothetical protein
MIIITALDNHRSIVVLDINGPRRRIVRMVAVVNPVLVMAVGVAAGVSAIAVRQGNSSTKHQDKSGK